MLLCGPRAAGGGEPATRQMEDKMNIGRGFCGMSGNKKISRKHLLVEADPADPGGFTMRKQGINPTLLRRADGQEIEIGEAPVPLRVGDKVWIMIKPRPATESLEQADRDRVLEVLGVAVDDTRDILVPESPPQASTRRRSRSPDERAAAAAPRSKRHRASPPAPSAAAAAAAAAAGEFNFDDVPHAGQVSDPDWHGGDDDMQGDAGWVRPGHEKADTPDRQGKPAALAVLVMVGTPGVGKTTFAETLIGSCGSVCWTRCSQDDEGDRGRVETRARKALSEGSSVVIDRTDYDRSQREHWIRIANEFGAQKLALVLRLDVDTCLSRAKQRLGHPSDQKEKDNKKTANDRANWDRICGWMEGHYRPIGTEGEEGFDWVHVIDGGKAGDAVCFEAHL